MFEKIIEKIENKILKNPFYLTEALEIVHNKALQIAIDILIDEGNIPFNPESFGFTIDFIKLDYLESWSCLKDDSYNAIHNVSDNIYNITTENYSIKNIKINSNFEGEIILKALGVIK